MTNPVTEDPSFEELECELSHLFKKHKESNQPNPPCHSLVEGVIKEIQVTGTIMKKNGGDNQPGLWN